MKNDESLDDMDLGEVLWDAMPAAILLRLLPLLLRFQDSHMVLLCEFRVGCVCVGDEVQVLLEASLQISGAIAAGEQQ